MGSCWCPCRRSLRENTCAGINPTNKQNQTRTANQPTNHQLTHTPGTCARTTTVCWASASMRWRVAPSSRWAMLVPEGRGICEHWHCHAFASPHCLPSRLRPSPASYATSPPFLHSPHPCFLHTFTKYTGSEYIYIYIYRYIYTVHIVI